MNKIFCLFFLCVLFFPNKGKSQNYDSLFAERERILLAGVDYQRGMIKWDAFRIASSTLDLLGERKINLNFSWTGQLIYDFDPGRGGVQGIAGLRYYYNLEERIIKRWMKKGLKTSCFSADYFEFDYGVGWNYGPWDTEHDYDPLPPGIITGPTLKMGMQRQIYKYFFVDVSLGYNVIINFRGRAVGSAAIGLRI